jgi:hypothetical protein
MPSRFPWKKGGDDNVDDLEPELQSKPTMASMQAEYSMQNSELNDSAVQYSDEVCVPILFALCFNQQ